MRTARFPAFGGMCDVLHTGAFGARVGWVLWGTIEYGRGHNGDEADISLFI